MVGFHIGLETVNVFANQTKLKALKDMKWHEQERRYGERDCRRHAAVEAWSVRGMRSFRSRHCRRRSM